MTLLSITDCCHLLGIDAKTLRQWLAQAQMSLHSHPTDARVKCLTSEQVNVLASLHGRVLQPLGFVPLQSSPKPDEPISRELTVEATEPSLRERLAQTEAMVRTLQVQLTELSLLLLHERASRTEQRRLPLENQLIGAVEPVRAHLVTPDMSLLSQPEVPIAHDRTSRRARLIPLIEYGANGNYVLICPKDGELHITPDTPAWFEWLASLSSFRFVGKSGRFSARRGPAPRSHHSWYAQRTIHQHYRCKYIGVTQNITIDRLENISAQFQSYVQ